MSKKRKRFDVFFRQINRQIITVTAKDPDEAAEKAERKYRKEYAWPTVDAVETAQNEPKDSAEAYRASAHGKDVGP